MRIKENLRLLIVYPIQWQKKLAGNEKEPPLYEFFVNLIKKSFTNRLWAGRHLTILVIDKRKPRSNRINIAKAMTGRKCSYKSIKERESNASHKAARTLPGEYNK